MSDTSKKRSKADVVREWNNYVSAAAAELRGFNPMSEGFNAEMERRLHRHESLRKLDPEKVAAVVLHKGLSFEDIEAQRGVSWTDLNRSTTEFKRRRRLTVLSIIAAMVLAALVAMVVCAS